MGKEIVGNFNKDLSKIEFYEIVDNYKIYTIIRKQATDKYYLYDNKLGVLSEELDITELPEDKNEYDKILNEKRTWYYGVVFFWADSKFVTEYGAPYYHKLVDIYKEVCNIKMNEVELLNTLKSIKVEEDFINYLRCKIIIFRILRSQRKTIKKFVKEFKLIW